MLNFEVASSSSFGDLRKNHFVTAAALAAYIDDSIKRKRIRFSLIKDIGIFRISMATDCLKPEALCLQKS